ncbi:MAG: hypothetical protein JO235_18905 [Chroococcidiopsidaceae cyanobacterium CP_BM_RX_35]|nr:hypothetical protein [Chroococcidiopsidaceae cyanobacterium CP_BM_RX_35]
MNSSVNPSSELSNFTSDQAQSDELAGSNRLQPIPPPSEPLQYRAIGLVRGCYKASAEQFTQGTLTASDGTEINAVLLGRIMSLVKNHLDLEQEHLWVVYPRSGQQDGSLHLQIVGVWEPEKLNQQLAATTTPTEEATESEKETEDGYFSVRGEVIYQSAAEAHFVVKIKQAPRKESESPKYFKLKLQGDLAIKAVGKFWDLQVKRQADTLVLQAGTPIAVLPSKPKLKKNKPRPAGHTAPKRNLDTPRPVRQTGDAMSVKRPIPKPALSSPPPPKPIKRQKPPQ